MDQNVEEKSGNGMKLRAPVGWTIAIAHVMSNVVNFIPAQLCFHSRFYRAEILAIRKDTKRKEKKCSTFINFYLRDDFYTIYRRVVHIFSFDNSCNIINYACTFFYIYFSNYKLNEIRIRLL